MVNKAIEPVRPWDAAMAASDWQRLAALADPGIEVIVDRGAAGGNHLGSAAVFDEYFPALRAAYANLRPAIDEIFAAEYDRATVRGRFLGRTVGGTDFEVAFTHLWWVSGARLVWHREHLDTPHHRMRESNSRAARPALGRAGVYRWLA